MQEILTRVRRLFRDPSSPVPSADPSVYEPATSDELLFARKVFIRRSRITPASITAQAAGVAQECLESQRFNPLELKVALLTNPEEIRDITITANRVHGVKRPDLGTLGYDDSFETIKAVFNLAERMMSLTPDELQELYTTRYQETHFVEGTLEEREARLRSIAEEILRAKRKKLHSTAELPEHSEDIW
ncbi:MAG: hypothetical protein HY428_01180 [Candidatus Levybacteria bacterium]|nr:hypothetical protein [Candidatus Levybacteria bacterium]